MPSINKSISIALLVGAASNVLAAPFVESNPCIVKLTETTVSISGVAGRFCDSKNWPEGYSEEQTRKCAAKETPADKEHAEKSCPEIKNCPPHMMDSVWKSCYMKSVTSSADQNYGMILDIHRIPIAIPGFTVGLDGKGKDGKGDEGKDGKGKDGKDDKGKDGEDGKDGKGKDDQDKDGKDGKKDGVDVHVDVSGDNKKGSKDADIITVVGSGKENDKGCPCAGKTSLITANAKAEVNGSH
ncbi:hypothetical protein PQX77_017888 [Marasmius sp. AFHP31]|nr:hypothetical protein PQX77_017888 [Marasmius sp. AFHP31]